MHTLLAPWRHEGSARGLYHRSGITPCPEGFYLVVEIIPYRALRISVRFDNAIDGADGHALGGIVMALAFDTGGLIDHIGDAIAFADGFGGAFGYARAAGDAIFGNFHCHDRYSFKNVYCDYKINSCPRLRQLTNIFYLVKFVTIL